MANIQDCPGFEPFGEDVKAARKKRRLSRQKAAEMAGISTVYLINIENNHIIPALPVIIQLIQIFNLPAAKYFNQLTAGEEHDQRQRISRKVMMCPEEHLPVIEGALDGAIESKWRPLCENTERLLFFALFKDFRPEVGATEDAIGYFK